jgi:MFS family permease
VIAGALAFTLRTPDEPLPAEFKSPTPISTVLLYFLADAAHYHDPQLGLLTLMALYAVALAITGGVCGTASDRSGRRKPFIVAAAVGCGTAAAILVVSPTWPAALVAASDRAKDLGVINVAYSLPLVVAPIIAGAVLGLMHSYPSLFALAGLASLAAAATVTRVRSVR